MAFTHPPHPKKHSVVVSPRRFDWVAWALPFLLFVGHFDEMEMRQFVARARGFVGVPAFQHLVGGL